MKKSLLSIVFVFLVLFAAGCGQDHNTAKPADTTIVINGEDMSSLVSLRRSGGQEEVVLAGSVSDYPVGGHIIIGDSKLSPGGRLFKVLDVMDNGDGTVTLACENGRLNEAVENADVQYSAILTKDDVVEIGSRALDARSVTWTDDITIDLGSVNLIEKIEEWSGADETDYGDSPVVASDILKLNIGGTIRLSPTINFDLEIKHFKTQYALFDISADIETDLSITGDLDYYYKYSIPLFDLKYCVIIIMAGPVPIILQPILTINLNMYGEIEATVTLKVVQQTELRVCAEKIGDAEWDTSKSEASFSKPEIEGLYPKISFTAGTSLSETVGILFYGVIGLQASMSEFAEFNATVLDGETSLLDENYDLQTRDVLFTGVSYQFETGIEADVGMMLSLFGFYTHNFNIWGDRWVLARWQLNEQTGYEINPETGIYGVWDFPAMSP
ncbi:MAG: hypothetical protein GY749_29155 [Desulfobacteraceae bacterium]|nr:hypothetical protein [Desulfobacteraceae bacterium]